MFQKHTDQFVTETNQVYPLKSTCLFGCLLWPELGKLCHTITAHSDYSSYPTAETKMVIAATKIRNQNGSSETLLFVRNFNCINVLLDRDLCQNQMPSSRTALLQHSDPCNKCTEIESGSIFYTPKKKKKNCFWPWLPQYWGPSHCVSSKSQSQFPVPSALAVEREDRWVYLWKVLYLQL